MKRVLRLCILAGLVALAWSPSYADDEPCYQTCQTVVDNCPAGSTLLGDCHFNYTNQMCTPPLCIPPCQTYFCLPI